MQELGFTRSARHRDHLLQTPDTFVRTPLPGLSGGLAIVHVGPALGADFAMMTVEFEPGGVLLACRTQRLLYVLSGAVTVQVADAGERVLHPGNYAYGTPELALDIAAQAPARVLLIEKRFEALVENHGEPAVPEPFFGQEDELSPTALNGDEDVLVRALVTPSERHDFAVNTMVYAPGAALGQVEVHYMEHGLLMLEGAGIYRLGDAWYPVKAGDFIWMAPFCPQWFGCIGKQPAKYIIYKNFNRHVLA